MEIKATCPKCNCLMGVIVEQKADIEGATFDCPGCKTVLIQKDNKIYPFHEWLNRQDGRWPEDGKETYSVNIQ